ncbi:MAG TPA: pyruvate kinase, partial [Burkholderiales bacterium]|nr:pyruvate kinase [Burkholderiales bacterium]
MGSDLDALMGKMLALHDSVMATQGQLLELWRQHIKKPEFHKSAANLAAYIGLRRHDLRELQSDLAAMGLSSLGRCEGHVLATLDAVTHALKRMLGEEVSPEEIEKSRLAMEEDQLLLKRHTIQLLGESPSHRWTRFMVTLPAEAATDHPFVRDLLTRGMSCARINCAHDNPPAWKNMIDNVRRAELEAGKRCRILMDLAGPKLRTGPVALGPPVLHVNPKRDREGKPVKEAHVVLDSSGRPGNSERPSLSVPNKWLKKLKAGDEVHFRDLLKRSRKLRVIERLSPVEVLTACSDSAYIGRGTKMEYAKGKAAETLDFSPDPLEIRLFEGDMLLLTRDPVPGEPQKVDASGNIVSPAHIPCQQPEVFSSLESGEKVWIDDGRMGALIE